MTDLNFNGKDLVFRQKQPFYSQHTVMSPCRLQSGCSKMVNVVGYSPISPEYDLLYQISVAFNMCNMLKCTNESFPGNVVKRSVVVVVVVVVVFFYI